MADNGDLLGARYGKSQGTLPLKAYGSRGKARLA